MIRVEVHAEPAEVRRRSVPGAERGCGVRAPQGVFVPGGQERACGRCQDQWGLSWQATPQGLMQASKDRGCAEAQRTLGAMLEMRKMDVVAMAAAWRR